jgi:Protein of unknown function (DUF3551)
VLRKLLDPATEPDAALERQPYPCIEQNNHQERIPNMRSILLASAAILIASSAPSMARDYPWCARTITNPDFGDCSFTSYRQCMATVSGQRGECVTNQRLAYGRQYRRDGSYRQGGPYGNGWDNRW